MDKSRDIADLLAIMARLRHPTEGCPWDVRQTFSTIVPYTLEEAYEVADAVERLDYDDLRDELGDLLLQVVFHSRMAEEQGLFDFGGVVEAITAKLIRRHPHVFGEARELAPSDVKVLWAAIKEDEKRRRRETRGDTPAGLLDGVPSNHPALTQALKLQEKAGTVGFDWNDVNLVVDKIQEEIGEVAAAMATDDTYAVEDEIGDLLFAVVNLARHAGIDPESALRRGNAKFRRRFGQVEQGIASQGRGLSDASLDDMEALWQAAKQREASVTPTTAPPVPRESGS